MVLRHPIPHILWRYQILIDKYCEIFTVYTVFNEGQGVIDEKVRRGHYTDGLKFNFVPM